MRKLKRIGDLLEISIDNNCFWLYDEDIQQYVHISLDEANKLADFLSFWIGAIEQKKKK